MIDKNKYIENGGNICPYCGSEHIDSGIITFETEISATVVCYDCNKVWKDIYKICDVEEMK